MEGHPPTSPHHTDYDDGKYVSSLSAILVATIQEAKERISQIEYIFCNQLYSNFQAKSKSLQQIYSEARNAAECEWKKKENDLLLQLNKLQLEKQQTYDENNALQLEKAKLFKQHEEHINLSRSLEDRVVELKGALVKKSEEFDEAVTVEKNLVLLLEEKSNAVVYKEKQLKEQEKTVNILVVNLKCLEEKVDELQKENLKKTEELSKGNKIREDLIDKIKLLNLKVADSELNDQKKSERVLAATVDKLLKVVTQEAGETDNGKSSKDADLNGSNRLEQVEEHEEQNMSLTEQGHSLEKNHDLQACLVQRSFDTAYREETYGRLLQQIESKDRDLQSEKKRTSGLLDAYKRLKSQYIYLCKKNGLIVDKMLPTDNVEAAGTDLLRLDQNQTLLSGQGNEKPETSAVGLDAKTQKNGMILWEKSEEGPGIKPVGKSTSHIPSSSKLYSPERQTNKTSAPLAGTKRSTSYWRDTRSRQRGDGPDPHDSFLDTPIENVRENLNRPMKEELCDLPGPVPADKNPESSDDETQDMNVVEQLKQQAVAPRNGMKSFKYSEPVRKKAERENLKGVECKQCKKFYDAVLDDGGKNSDGSKHTTRCEHHDGVSRHRYSTLSRASKTTRNISCCPLIYLAQANRGERQL